VQALQVPASKICDNAAMKTSWTQLPALTKAWKSLCSKTEQSGFGNLAKCWYEKTGAKIVLAVSAGHWLRAGWLPPPRRCRPDDSKMEFMLCNALHNAVSEI
jgi:hypothetical protein